VARFLEGLKEEIRSVIAIHRSQDMDIVYSLALMQKRRLTVANARLDSKNEHSATRSG
jgi:hypothetical protein